MPPRRPLQRLQLLALPVLVRWAIRALGTTWRITVSGGGHFAAARAAPRPIVGATLHGRVLPLCWWFSRPGRRGWCVLSSRSFDGELMVRTLRPLGYVAVRGSSSRGGAAALLGVLRHLRRRPRFGVAFTVDGGGRGPRGRCKPGVVRAAARSGALLLPCVASARPALVATRSWDRFLVPAPFARVHLAFGAPLEPPPAGPAAEAAMRRRLERILARLQAEADAHTRLRDAPLPSSVAAGSRTG